MPKYDDKSALLRHSSLFQQNTVKFGTDFTRARKKFTQALLARLYVIPSLWQTLGGGEINLDILNVCSAFSNLLKY